MYLLAIKRHRNWGYQKSSNNITGDVEWFEPEPLQGMIF